MNKESLISYFDNSALRRDKWKKRNWYYHAALKDLIQFLIPQGQSVLEIGCGTGDLLQHARPKRGVGIDISHKMLTLAKDKYSHLEFIENDAEKIDIREQFDYVFASDLIGYLEDVEKFFRQLSKVTDSKSRVVITYYNYIWEPFLKLAEALRLKQKQPRQNWLSSKDIENVLYLGGFEVIKSGTKMIFPVYIPLISAFLNRFVGNLPLIDRFGLIQYLVARQIPRDGREYSVSIVIPCRNEKGNIENAIKRVPRLGIYTEIIFIEKGSSDGTYEEIERVAGEYGDRKNIRYMKGEIDTKRDKVRQAFEAARGDILMILDADLTVRPEDLPKFYRAIASGRGEFINGSRLVYQLEDASMRFLNILGNKFFSVMFSWLLGQRLKDTLCGTKVLFKKDYELIAKNRHYFGDFDPFGDFDLLFGAAKLNLKIVEIPIRYQARTYGSTNIQRWRHGWLLLKMTFFAMRKIKFV
jgi:ubiquinone/menaquinone biosynthesis C-methylase UbiE